MIFKKKNEDENNIVAVFGDNDEPGNV